MFVITLEGWALEGALCPGETDSVGMFRGWGVCKIPSRDRLEEPAWLGLSFRSGSSKCCSEDFRNSEPAARVDFLNGRGQARARHSPIYFLHLLFTPTSSLD